MTAKEILQQAETIVTGDRQTHYGHPSVNHGCTADLWTIYIKRVYGVDIELDARDVCWLNILQKISRDANAPKEDNIVDTIGYALNIAMLGELE